MVGVSDGSVIPYDNTVPGPKAGGIFYDVDGIAELDMS